MALTGILTIASLTKTDEGSNTNLTDATVYGGANPLRSATASALLAFKVNESLEETALDVTPYDPASAVNFVVENTIDGHQKFVLLIILRYSVASTYNLHDVVYNVSNGLYYKSISATPIIGVDPTNPGSWVLTTPDEIYETIGTATAPPNLVYTITQTVLTAATKVQVGLYAIQNAKDNCCDGCSNPKLRDQFTELWSLIYAADTASVYEMYTEGEKFMRLADSYCTT